jgi:arsenical pump membrane protein
MYILVKRKLPKRLPNSAYDIEQMFFTKNFHPLKGHLVVETKRQRTKFMLKILLFVFLMRSSLFIASFFSIPIEFVAVLGSLILLIWRWYYLRTKPIDILKKTPWHIFIFAFSMYVLIYGLHNSGLTELLVKMCEPIVQQGLFEASFIMGGLISVLSNLFNNHPALLVGTIALTEMNLDSFTLQTMYLASIIGSDVGSLLLPIGTLASLIWMHILKQHRIKVKWKDYLSVSLIVIPITVIVMLFLLYNWLQLFFAS